jgi:hypothetical protein
MIFLTQALVNKPVKFELEAKKYFYNFFRKKRTDWYVLHTRFTFHSISLQSKYSIKSQKSTRDPQINSKGSTNIFWNFLISKVVCLTRYQNKREWNQREKT